MLTGYGVGLVTCTIVVNITLKNVFLATQLMFMVRVSNRIMNKVYSAEPLYSGHFGSSD